MIIYFWRSEKTFMKMKHQSRSKVRSYSTNHVHGQNAEKELAQKTQGTKFRHVTRVKRENVS